ncbi:hypothetical protein [Deinococcus puniceus]|uniref:hypothetical protein n=1 Tax=Deinococcus puniceus TaxID=1182568 RepID=UPI0012FC8019|nr:hypothetical protein [Deinococcus puniceus]
MTAPPKTQILSSEPTSQLLEQVQHELRRAYVLYATEYATDAEEQAEAEAWLHFAVQEVPENDLSPAAL